MTADLDALRRYVGAASTNDDVLLQERLDTARAWVESRIMPAKVGVDEAEEAILLLASRLYKRRQSPEGAAGFGGEGIVVRVVANDPDIKALLERLADHSNGLDANGVRVSEGLGLG